MRSWLMMTAQPAKSSSASSSARQRLGVEIVGRFVEQQHVGAGLQHLGEMDAVALSAGQVADLLLLVGALEVERRAIGARVDLALAEQRSPRCRRRSPPRRLVRSSASRDWST
jgi:hypothetical protein